jgi:hypothetical protein
MTGLGRDGAYSDVSPLALEATISRLSVRTARHVVGVPSLSESQLGGACISVKRLYRGGWPWAELAADG